LFLGDSCDGSDTLFFRGGVNSFCFGGGSSGGALSLRGDPLSLRDGGALGSLDLEL